MRKLELLSNSLKYFCFLVGLTILTFHVDGQDELNDSDNDGYYDHEDPDPYDPNVYPGSESGSEYPDSDGDGYYDFDDPDPYDSNVYPGSESGSEYPDSDGDGYYDFDDPDPYDPNIYPGSTSEGNSNELDGDGSVESDNETPLEDNGIFYDIGDYSSGEDQDGDLLSDEFEQNYQGYSYWDSQPVDYGDGFISWEPVEITLYLDCKNPDSDFDGLNDGDELVIITPLFQAFGIPYEFDPLESSDGLSDWDGDGLHNSLEIVENGSNIFQKDTDADSYDDFVEWMLGSDPTDPNDPVEFDSEEGTGDVVPSGDESGELYAPGGIGYSGLSTNSETAFQTIGESSASEQFGNFDTSLDLSAQPYIRSESQAFLKNGFHRRFGTQFRVFRSQVDYSESEINVSIVDSIPSEGVKTDYEVVKSEDLTIKAWFSSEEIIETPTLFPDYDSVVGELSGTLNLERKETIKHVDGDEAPETYEFKYLGRRGGTLTGWPYTLHVFDQSTSDVASVRHFLGEAIFDNNGVTDQVVDYVMFPGLEAPADSVTVESLNETNWNWKYFASQGSPSLFAATTGSSSLIAAGIGERRLTYHEAIADSVLLEYASANGRLESTFLSPNDYPMGSMWVTYDNVVASDVVRNKGMAAVEAIVNTTEFRWRVANPEGQVVRWYEVFIPQDNPYTSHIESLDKQIFRKQWVATSTESPPVVLGPQSPDVAGRPGIHYVGANIPPLEFIPSTLTYVSADEGALEVTVRILSAVRDQEGGWPHDDGVVEWEIFDGNGMTLASETSEIEAGIASNTLNMGSLAGSSCRLKARIHSVAGQEMDVRTSRWVVSPEFVVVPGKPSRIDVTSTKSKFVADGNDSAELTATVFDAYDNLVHDETPVAWWIYQSATECLGQRTNETLDGEAVAAVYAPILANGPLKVMITCADVEAEHSIPVERVSASIPTEIDLNLTEHENKQITVETNASVGTPVHWGTSSGTLTNPVTYVALDGTATTTLLSANGQVGNAYVRATIGDRAIFKEGVFSSEHGDLQVSISERVLVAGKLANSTETVTFDHALSREIPHKAESVITIYGQSGTECSLFFTYNGCSESDFVIGSGIAPDSVLFDASGKFEIPIRSMGTAGGDSSLFVTALQDGVQKDRSIRIVDPGLWNNVCDGVMGFFGADTSTTTGMISSTAGGMLVVADLGAIVKNFWREVGFSDKEPNDLEMLLGGVGLLTTAAELGGGPPGIAADGVLSALRTLASRAGTNPGTRDLVQIYVARLKRALEGGVGGPTPSPRPVISGFGTSSLMFFGGAGFLRSFADEFTEADRNFVEALVSNPSFGDALTSFRWSDDLVRVATKAHDQLGDQFIHAITRLHITQGPDGALQMLKVFDGMKDNVFIGLKSSSARFNSIVDELGELLVNDINPKTLTKVLNNPKPFVPGKYEPIDFMEDLVLLSNVKGLEASMHLLTSVRRFQNNTLGFRYEIEGAAELVRRGKVVDELGMKVNVTWGDALKSMFRKATGRTDIDVIVLEEVGGETLPVYYQFKRSQKALRSSLD